MMIIPFTKKFSDEEKDVYLYEKLKKELSGIFNFAIEGLMRLRKQKYRFSPCAKAENAHMKYFEEKDMYSSFIENCLEIVLGDEKPKEKIEIHEMFAVFWAWALDNEDYKQEVEKLKQEKEKQKLETKKLKQEVKTDKVLKNVLHNLRVKLIDQGCFYNTQEGEYKANSKRYFPNVKFTEEALAIQNTLLARV
jgi:putative DNA primase/helicase